MPIIKFVNEDDEVEYKTEDVVKTLLYYAFNPEKTKAYGCQFVGCKPFLFQKEYSKNPFVVHKFMEFNHRRQYKHQRNLAKHRVVSFGLQECIQPCSLRSLAENIVSFYANKGYIAAYAIHFMLLPAPSCKPCRSWGCPLRCAGTGSRCSFWSCGEDLRGWQNRRLR